MKRARELASERLHKDIENAITIAAAHAARQGAAEQGMNRLYTIMNLRQEIRDSVIAALRRNWTVTERARPERSAT